jgi:hypothetical protein
MTRRPSSRPIIIKPRKPRDPTFVEHERSDRTPPILIPHPKHRPIRVRPPKRKASR